MADVTLISTKTPRKRGPGKRFAAGQSGNPGGRPKLPSELRERAQHYAVEMLEILRELAIDPDEKGPVRVAAAIAVLDRGYGKPVAPIVAASTEMSWGDLVVASMQSREERSALASVQVDDSAQEA